MDAVLLLGPTGAGKTPLGHALEARGWGGRGCLHFDFGACLRAAADGGTGLDPGQQALVARVLAEGRLLEDHEFHVAAALLEAFLAGFAPAPRDLLVLNGLPRHEGQARRVDAVHHVRWLVRLHASAEVVHERIRRDSGGDRAGRGDDDAARVAARLERFERRSAALEAHYRARGAACLALEVGTRSTAGDLLAALPAEPPRA